MYACTKIHRLYFHESLKVPLFYVIFKLFLKLENRTLSLALELSSSRSVDSKTNFNDRYWKMVEKRGAKSALITTFTKVEMIRIGARCAIINSVLALLTRFIGSSDHTDKEKLIFRRHQFFKAPCRTMLTLITFPVWWTLNSMSPVFFLSSYRT